VAIHHEQEQRDPSKRRMSWPLRTPRLMNRRILSRGFAFFNAYSSHKPAERYGFKSVVRNGTNNTMMVDKSISQGLFSTERCFGGFT
jgi:hypothetical protein